MVGISAIYLPTPYLFIYLLCMYMFMSYVHVCAGTHAGSWVRQSVTESEPSVLLGWLDSELQSFTCLPSWHWDCRCITTTPSFYVAAGDPNSGPYACTAGALPTEPPPQPLTCIFLKIFIVHGTVLHKVIFMITLTFDLN